MWRDDSDSIINRHKRWLKEFSRMKQEERTLSEELRQQEQQKGEHIRKRTLKKIRHHSAEVKERNRFTEDDEGNVQRPKDRRAEVVSQEQELPEPVLQELKNEVRKEVRNSPIKAKLNKKNVEKLPKWARTQEQHEEDVEAEVDDLLNFTNNLDFEDVINDIEVRAAIKAVKSRVDELKQEEQKQQKQQKLDKIRESDAKKKDLNLNDDNNRSELRSQLSEGQKSIAESKIDERIEELKKSKKEGKDKDGFDTSSRLGDAVGADDYEKLAKNIADKVLQSNHQLRDKHSNKSIRALLEREAIRELRTGPNIVVHKDKDIELGQRFSKNGLNQP